MRASIGTALLMGCATTPNTFPNETKTYSGIERIEVRTDSGRVEIVEHDDADVKVTLLLVNANERWADDTSGGTLLVEATCADDSPGCTAGFIIHSPATTAIDVITNSGDIDLEGGLIGELSLRTTSGVTKGDGLGALALSMLTNAEVDLAFAERPRDLEIDGGAGDLRVALPAGDYALDLSAIGEVTVDPAIGTNPDGPRVVLECLASITVDAQ